ncbi:hypothetical protein OROHE_003501 [Orobanche hederae]
MSSWTNFLQSSNENEKGVEDYLDKAFATQAIGDQITCPCKVCYNRFWHDREIVYNHLIANGIQPGTEGWNFRENGISSMLNVESLGEDNLAQDDMDGLIYDTHRDMAERFAHNLEGVGGVVDTETKKFYRLVEDGKQEPFPGQLQDNEKKRPSDAQLYKESRKRKVEKIYKTCYEPIKANIDKMDELQIQRQIDGDKAYHEVMKSHNRVNQRQLGRYSTIKGKKSKITRSVGGVIIPDEFLKPYKDQIVKDTVGEVMKMFKQQLPPETFTNLAQSLRNVSSDLEITEHPSKDPNAEKLHEDDEDDGLR